MTTTHIKYVIIILIFFAGLYFYVFYYGKPRLLEGMTGSSGERCPNLLIQKGSKYYLYNSKLATVPGVNPIEFNNLEEYTEFLEWQHKVGIRCPVLYVQNTYDAQGNRVYKMRPSVSEPEGGLPPAITQPTNTPKILSESDDTLAQSNPNLLPAPLKFKPLVDAGHGDAPYNQNSYPSYDPSNYYLGYLTPLDMIKTSNSSLRYSDNPMDPNWGGTAYTQSLVDSGYYAENNVKIAIPQD